MIENDAYCNDVLIQLSAVENSVKSLLNHVLENHYLLIENILKTRSKLNLLNIYTLCAQTSSNKM